jgi:N-acetylglucosaminyldiphosphoundecaprenol N-acetyl-beta-D-mannosaminyltransferase
MSAAAPRRDLLGCGFDALTAAETMKQVDAWRNDPDRKTHTIITVNVAILMMMRSDADLAAAIRKADIVVADGAPIVWASRWLRARLPERITGVDLTQDLLKSAAKPRLRIFLLGATEQRLRKLVNMINENYEGVDIVGFRNGYFDRSESPEIVRHIREAKPDVLLVGMPAPFKEVWCEEHRAALQVPTILGVGGAFDVMAGFVPRAPKLLQHVGLEWLWRLAMEPRKLWKRYLTTNSQFMSALAGELAKSWRRRA